MFVKKLKIILQIMKIFKNWYMYSIVYFKLTNKKFVIFKTKTNLKIKLRVRSTDLMALTHVWLIQEYYNNDFKINDNDIIIDIGAHIGLFSLYASQFCKNGKIYCFEPVKENFDLFLSNIKLNKIENIFPFNIAVSNKSSIAKIYLNKDEAGHSMFHPTLSSIEVKSTTLQKIFEDNNLEKCDFLKLDCEGAEYNIMDSLSKEFFQKIRKMVIEYHFANTEPGLLKNLIEKLENFSFRISIKPLFSDIGFLYCVNQQLK